jgi:hypothetical protein
MRETAQVLGRPIRPQYTIGGIMIVVAVCAVVLTMTRSAIGTLIVASFVALNVYVFRLTWSMPPLPKLGSLHPRLSPAHIPGSTTRSPFRAIGRLMIVVAVWAVFLAIFRSSIGASIAASFFALYTYVSWRRLAVARRGRAAEAKRQFADRVRQPEVVEVGDDCAEIRPAPSPRKGPSTIM